MVIFIIVAYDGDILTLESRPLIGLLNSMVARHGSSGPIGENLIYIKYRVTSALVSKQFFFILLINSMYGSP